MKRRTIMLSALLFLTASLFAKPRLLITTDIGGDPDDSQSLVRLLLYANEFDIAGLIASASGTPGELDEAITRPDLIEERVRAYGEVLPHLLKHDADYPTKESLLERIKSGNKFRGMDYIGADHDTDGSNHIISVVDDSKEQLNIAIWGGQTDLAQALWRVRHDRSSEQLAAFIAKIRVYDIADQDGLFDWIHSNFSDLWYILNKSQKGADSREAVFRGMYLSGDEDLTSQEWLRENISRNHGPLGEAYPDSGLWTSPNPHGALKEGDTPSWFYFLQNGLSDADHPDCGGWGGRFTNVSQNLYRDATDALDGENSARTTVWRWRPDFQNDFATRMDWCVNTFDGTNHNPIAVVNGNRNQDVLVINATPGETIELDATGSSDPDGHTLTYKWWIYQDVTTFPGELVIMNATSQKASIAIPIDFSQHSAHVICEVVDNGEPSLKAYRRIVLVGDKYDYYIKKTLDKIDIDAWPEAAWEQAQERQIRKPAGIMAPLSDLSGVWRALWDDDNLYIYIDIWDGAPTLNKSAGLEHDAIHIYIDSDRDYLNPDTNFHYEVSKLSSLIFERENDALSGVEFKTYISEFGFSLELAVPWRTIKKDMSDDKLNIEIRALDYPDRNAALPEATIAWAFAGAQSPFETGNLGTAFLGDLQPRDNAAPQAHILTPLEGASFPFAETINIVAEPFDADGVINAVEFYAGDKFLGRDLDNLDGWNLAWKDAPAGNHDIYIRAIDDSFLDVESESVRIVVFEPNAETVLFVTGDDLTPGELAVKQRFEQEHGYMVICLDDDSVTTQNGDNKVLIYLAESIRRGKIGDVFTKSVVPIICADQYLLSDLKMTGSTVNADFGVTSSQVDNMAILWADHELAAGLTETPTVLYQAEKMVWGAPTQTAQIIAGVADNKNQSTIFAYEKGDAMIDMVAPSTRLGFFLTTNALAQINENGWALFDVAVKWAIQKHITHSDTKAVPVDHVLISNYPNPFNPVTRFFVTLPENQNTIIKIYNLRGQHIKTLAHQRLNAGSHTFSWDATNQSGAQVAGGVYVARFEIGDETRIKKITLLK